MIDADGKAAYAALVEVRPVHPAPTDPGALIADLYADCDFIAPPFGAGPKALEKVLSGDQRRCDRAAGDNHHADRPSIPFPFERFGVSSRYREERA